MLMLKITVMGSWGRGGVTGPFLLAAAPSSKEKAYPGYRDAVVSVSLPYCRAEHGPVVACSWPCLSSSGP